MFVLKALWKPPRILNIENTTGGISIAYKERTKPRHLRILEILNARMKLEIGDYYYYLNLKKGFNGECRFDEYTEQFEKYCLILNDLQLEIKRAPFQVDALLICFDRILLYEIKNYEGVHIWGKEKFTKPSGAALENPSMQLSKTKVRLELLLQSLGYQMQVEAYVVFINPEFTLLGAPTDGNFILPTEIPGHFRTLQMTEPTNEQQRKLAKQLTDLHDPNYPTKLSAYNYGQLEKGMSCVSCGTLAKTIKGHHQICDKCGNKTSVRKAIINSIEEFRFLFPEEKITSKRITEWCGLADPDRVYRVLKEYYQPMGSDNGRYYI
ncbi:nuclease-like protein [Trichococcus patagoniensis]|uniref:Nuclease-like protein n=1 Tax=Trichococcus patagoniensis TaxID=382641 RepID=A0A2T5IJ06_9LACT|nr:nuclease-related domain-containing protein [Trichococcus patagoniensis]PTQ83807.1 nuclease-like protein [Trichococcus patagoniensis]